MKRKIKILATGDIHGDRILVRKLAEKAKKENVDLVIICGDITFAEHDLDGLIGPFKEAGRKIAIIPGNHETLATVEFLVEKYSPGIYNLHCSSLILDDVGFFGCGSGNIGLFSMDEDEVFNCLSKAFKRIKNARKKILITHVPPIRTKLDNLIWTYAGSPAIREIIEKLKPDVCLCAHIHETFGMSDQIGKTKILNVGRTATILEF